MKKLSLLLVVFFLTNLATVAQTYFPYYNGENWCVYNIILEETTATTDWDSIAAFEHHYSDEFESFHEFSIAYKNDFEAIINYKDSILLDSCINISYLEGHNGVVFSNFILDYYSFSKGENDLFGIYSPRNQMEMVPPIYDEIQLIVNMNFDHFYQGFDKKNKKLSLHDLNIKRDSLMIEFDADSIDVRERDEILFTHIDYQGKSMVVNHFGKILIPLDIYESLRITYDNEIIVNDYLVYNIQGEFVRNLDISYDETYMEVDSAADQLSYTQKDNVFTLKNGEKVALNPEWQIVKVIENLEDLIVLYEWNGKSGLYDVQNQKSVHDAKWKEANVLRCGTKKSHYLFHENLETSYSKQIWPSFIHVTNADGLENIYDIQRMEYLFKTYAENIYRLDYYDFDDFYDFFLFENEGEIAMYNLNGKLVQSGIISLDAMKSYNGFDLDNYGELDKFIFGKFKNGWQGYFYIDGTSNKVIPCFPNDLK